MSPGVKLYAYYISLHLRNAPVIFFLYRENRYYELFFKRYLWTPDQKEKKNNNKSNCNLDNSVAIIRVNRIGAVNNIIIYCRQRFRFMDIFVNFFFFFQIRLLLKFTYQKSKMCAFLRNDRSLSMIVQGSWWRKYLLFFIKIIRPAFCQNLTTLIFLCKTNTLFNYSFVEI